MKEKVSGFIGGLKSNPKRLAIIALVIVVFVLFIRGFNARRQEEKLEQERLAQEELEKQQAELNADVEVNEYAELYDQDVIKRQDQLVQRYGTVPKGYLWDLDGTLISLGDKSKTAEEALYAYLNGIRTLDFSSAQKFSRGSDVVKRYEGFFDSGITYDTDYLDAFYRNMYTQVLSSIQIKDVKSTAVFAESKQIFTVELEMLDLSSKDFWEEDKEDIYKTLYVYGFDEEDDIKAEQYVYDYVLDYYKSKEAITKNVTVNITVEKYAKLDTGWLVTIDSDVDAYCYYEDGNIVAKYILQKYRNEGKFYVKELRAQEAEEGEDDVSIPAEIDTES